MLIATPVGEGGRGGIDRMMDLVRAELIRNPPADMRVRFGTTRGPGSIWFSPFYLTAFLAKMVWLRATGRCDVVHINLSSYGSTYRKLCVASFARVLGIRYIVHLHSGVYNKFFVNAAIPIQKAVAWLFEGASVAVVLGNCWRTFLIESGLASANQVRALPNSTKTLMREGGRSNDGVVRILFLGLLGNNKGIPQLVEALGWLKNWKEWRAVLAGDGDVEKTKKELRVRGIADRVVVPGWVGPEEVENLLLHSDILVLPSFAENLPMSVIEGMAAGLAVVTTPVGATPDIILEGETGLLVPPGDADALTVALKRLIGNEALRCRLGATAQIFHREHLEIGAYVRNLCSMWRSVA